MKETPHVWTNIAYHRKNEIFACRYFQSLGQEEYSSLIWKSLEHKNEEKVTFKQKFIHCFSKAV
jgi:hypothetical protein